MFFFWVAWACCSDPGRPNSPVILTSSVPVSISLEVHPVCFPRDGRQQRCHRHEGLLGRPASQRSAPPAPRLLNDARPAVVMGGSWVDLRGTEGVPLSRVQGSLCLDAAMVRLLDAAMVRLPVAKASDSVGEHGLPSDVGAPGSVGERGLPSDVGAPGSVG